MAISWHLLTYTVIIMGYMLASEGKIIGHEPVAELTVRVNEQKRFLKDSLKYVAWFISQFLIRYCYGLYQG